MKKYLFLLLLFIIYIILIINNKSQTVLSYDNINDYGVSSYNLMFENGINSYNLTKIFKKYKDEYFITSIITSDKEKYSLSCSYIEKCISDIYKQENNDFDTNHINGIKVSNITLIAYSDNITKFLNENNIYYKEEKETN